MRPIGCMMSCFDVLFFSVFSFQRYFFFKLIQNSTSLALLTNKMFTHFVFIFLSVLRFKDLRFCHRQPKKSDILPHRSYVISLKYQVTFLEVLDLILY